MQSRNFFTLGYEQSDFDSFLERLRVHRIALIVDVRQLPLSRKKGFSKNQLRQRLAEAGIDYLHLKTLGAPKPLRDRLRRTGSWPDYAREYKKLLRQRGEDIETLIHLIAQHRLCLLCFERDPARCHRSLVAAAIEKRAASPGLRVEHIRY